MVLSIIVASWNTADLLRALLRSIRKFPPAMDHEVIVVDNGSTDGTREMLEREFPAIEIIRNSENTGYAHANNQGFRRSVGDLVLLLGSDTELIDGSLSSMIDLLMRQADVGAVCCRLLNPDGTPQVSCRHFPSLLDGVATYLSLHWLAGDYNMKGFDFKKTQEVEQPAATCLLVRRTVIHDNRLFDEKFSILYNDVDLCRRIRDGGHKIMFDGRAEILHKGSQTTRRATPELRQEMYRNILLYYHSQYGAAAAFLLLPILVARLAIVNRGRSVLGLLRLNYLRQSS